MKQKINDLNVHPIELNKLEIMIKNDKQISTREILNFIKKDKKQNSSRRNIMVMNENLLLNNNERKKMKLIVHENKNLDFTFLLNFRKKKLMKKILLNDNFIKRVKLHSYFQKIKSSDFKNIFPLIKILNEKKISILIDASYGTLGMYDYDNIKLIIEVCKRVKNTPVVILHSGTVNVLKAMIVALSSDNVFLETSFALDYYNKPKFWDEYNFAYEKVGYKKIIYGSDSPYVDKKKSISTIKKFFSRYNYTKKTQKDIFYKNYLKV